jgi:hypothetical protein
MTIKEKLDQHDLFDQAILRHGMLDNIRDYEIIGSICGQNYKEEVQFVFKGCIRADFKVIVKPEHYSMDDRLLDLSRQNESDYPKAFIWGVNYAVTYPGLTLTENTDELIQLEKIYGRKFHKIFIETNAYELTLIFHDLETKVLKRAEDNINTTKDFLLYKKIDDILWFDWDPIGINKVAPRDEYQGYIPEILNLKKSGADRVEIAKRLLKLETEIMGIGGTLENCLLIADKIINAT